MEPPNKVAKLCEAPAPSPEEAITEKDLPLLANVQDVRVHHYLMKFFPNFSKQVVNGTIIVFLEWLNVKQKQIILDQCFLKINRVLVLKTGDDFDVLKSLSEYDNHNRSRKYFYRSCKNINWFDIEEHSQQLEFEQSKWSLTIHRRSDTLPPSVLRIDYETLDVSPSIHWRPCDGFKYNEASFKCCYTPAPAMNNRGLFPCQEPPSAMATWEALLECERRYTPLLTSDEPGEIVGTDEEGRQTHYFSCSMPLPMSTFAMIIGEFCFKKDLKPDASIGEQVLEDDDKVPNNPCLKHSKYPCRFGNAYQRRQKFIPVRLYCFDPDTVVLDWSKFTSVVFSSLITCFDTLGPHPFSRLDIVIVPKSYPHEALTSPSMIFISPNNFYGGEPMYICRFPHEICHSWFGLLIGSLDWTEEWLSEGFATYCEDALFPILFKAYCPEKNEKSIERDQALKILMRFTSLQTELRNTDDSLHVISKGQSEENSQSSENGLVPIKQFMHVHYYKGYLLLWYLASLVGQAEFLKFLKKYVWHYHGQLVTSEIFLEYYHSHFSSILCYQDCDTVMRNLKKEWLQSNKLPEPYNSLDLLYDDNLSEDNVPPLFSKAVEPLKNIKHVFDTMLENESSPEHNFNLEKLSATEILLLMEFILTSSSRPNYNAEKCKIMENVYYKYFATSMTLHNVDQLYNADVAHRWCELILLFKDKSRLSVVEKFLRDNIAMGVYLYGELMITERYVFQKKAKQLYYELQNLYDLATKKILKEMIL